MGRLIDAQHQFRMQGALQHTQRFSEYYNRPLGKDLHQNALVPGISNIALLRAAPKILLYTIHHGIPAPQLPRVLEERKIVEMKAYRRTPPTPAS